MARSMLSLGMFSFFAARIAVRRRGFEFTSPPPIRAAMVISRINLVKTRPRLASVAAFLCLIVAHFECPDMTFLFSRDRCAALDIRDDDAVTVDEFFRPPRAYPGALAAQTTMRRLP